MKIEFLPDPRTIPFFHPAVKAGAQSGKILARATRRCHRCSRFFIIQDLPDTLCCKNRSSWEKAFYTAYLANWWISELLSVRPTFSINYEWNDAREASRDITYANVCVIRIVYTVKGIVYDGQGHLLVPCVIRIITYIANSTTVME